MRHYLKWLVIPIVVLSLVPTRKVLIADWAVRVTDEMNNPISGIRVSENWQNYTLSLSGGSDLYTNADGRAEFAKREQRAPVSYWLARSLWTKVTYGAHASSGVVGTVRVSDPRLPAPAGANCADSSCTARTITSQLRVSAR
jgi:hypothetical protein